MKTTSYSPKTGKVNLPMAFVYLFLLFLLISSIWFFSSQTGEESSSLSRALIHWLHLERLPEIQFLIRKAAHFSIYLVMGMLWYLFYDALGFTPGYAVLAAVCFSIVFAGLDELHQTFIPQRAGQFRDVVLDSIGAIVGTCLICVLQSHIHKHHHFSKPAPPKSGQSRKTQNQAPAHPHHFQIGIQ